MKTILIYLLVLFSFPLKAKHMHPFSLEKLEFLKDFKVKKPLFIKASDGINLAYYSYIPESPKAIVLFYHGAGFYSSALYQNFAKELANKHQIGCYLFDIRGHGNSQGDRGDASSINQVWDDVTTAINFVSTQHPELPLYLGGHSSGGGMVLNYSNYHHHPLLKGYLFIAPYLGRNSDALQKHDDPAASFVKSVRVWVFILYGISGGYFFAHTPAVYFNYPEKLLKNDPKIIDSYTVTMMAVTSPENPQELFAKIDKPFGLFAAENDEQFIAQKIIDYKKHAPTNVANDSLAQIIGDTHHLDILLSAADYCAQFINT